MYLIDASSVPAVVTQEYTQDIGDMCAHITEITKNLAVISCPEYNNNAGRIDVYTRSHDTEDYSLTHLVTVNADEGYY